MPLIHEVFTASNLAGYYGVASGEGVDQTLGRRLFPERKQLGLNLSYIKGANETPVVLKASEFDTEVTLRDRMEISLHEETLPFFREGMLIKEKDRQQLNTLEQTGNQALIDTVVNTIFNDQAKLLTAAHARLEAMRMRVLATGVIDTVSDGVPLNFDYNVPEENKGTVAVSWADEGADPLADIEQAKTALEELGKKPEIIIMNSNTFSLIRNAPATQNYIDPNGGKVKRSDVIDYLSDELELTIELKNDTFKDDDGVVKKYYPNGRVTLIPNEILGYTVFGTTPEESDLVSGNDLTVSIVDTGIAITTETHTKPVNVETNVSMITLPSFENITSVYMLEVVPEP
ncbi:major capsid protein [Aerococcaceae bacterium WGS1372]